MTDWMKQIHQDIKKQIDKYERGKFTYTDDEINKIMPKVVEFYNNHPEDQDVYRDADGVILLIQTPKVMKNKDGDILNKPMPFDSLYGDEKQYMLTNCKFRMNGKTETMSIFASKEEWAKIKDIYDQKAFVKATQLKLRYKKLGSEDKPMNIAGFLKLHELEDIDELDASEYLIYYSINISQVIS